MWARVACRSQLMMTFGKYDLWYPHQIDRSTTPSHLYCHCATLKMHQGQRRSVRVANHEQLEARGEAPQAGSQKPHQRPSIGSLVPSVSGCTVREPPGSSAAGAESEGKKGRYIHKRHIKQLHGLRERGVRMAYIDSIVIDFVQLFLQ